MTIRINLFLMMLMTFGCNAQIGREFKFEKIKGDTVRSTEVSCENTQLDENGKPILTEKAERKTVNFYQKGYLVESQNFECDGETTDLSIRILLKRAGSAVRSAEVYSYWRGKESLLQAYDAEIENGKIVSEKIRNQQNEIIGDVQYLYGKTDKGLDFEWIDLVGNRGSKTFYTESDEHGTVFSMETFADDTLMSLTRLERQGDTLTKSLLVAQSNWNTFRDSVLMTVRKWFDSKGNPTLILTQMEALTAPPPGEPKATNFVSSISYQYGKSAVRQARNFPNQEEIVGAWRSESNNLELFFEPESDNGKPRMYGTSYLSKSNEPSLEQLQAAGEVWKFMLKQDFAPGTWTLDDKNGNLTIVLKNGSVLEFSTTLDIKTLVLTPTMKGMNGSLRLVKSK